MLLLRSRLLRAGGGTRISSGRRSHGMPPGWAFLSRKDQLVTGISEEGANETTFSIESSELRQTPGLETVARGLVRAWPPRDCRCQLSLSGLRIDDAAWEASALTVDSRGWAHGVVWAAECEPAKNGVLHVVVGRQLETVSLFLALFDARWLWTPARCLRLDQRTYRVSSEDVKTGKRPGLSRKTSVRFLAWAGDVFRSEQE